MKKILYLLIILLTASLLLGHGSRSKNKHAALAGIKVEKTASNFFPSFNNFYFQQNLEQTIQEIVSKVNQDTIRANITHLESYGTRFMLHSNREEVSEWIFNKFLEYGADHVEYDEFEAHISIYDNHIVADTTTFQRNVVATINGSGNEEQVVLVCGHYDSFNSTINPFLSAPGASDNASGTTALLEMVRVIKESGYVPERTMKFVAMAAEELMNFGDAGSEHYAQMVYDQGMNLKFVINHDMICHNRAPIEESVVSINRHPDNEHYGLLGAACVEQFSRINWAASDYAGADLRTFTELGFPGIYFEEYDFSPYYHSADDVVENYDMEFCAEIIKASCATFISSAELPMGIETFSVEDKDNGTSVSLEWNAEKDSDFKNFRIYYHRIDQSSLNIVETVDYKISINDLVPGIEYIFGIAAVDEDDNESYINWRSFIPVSFSFDKGVLVIDDTFDGNGVLLSPTDDEVDSFYDFILNGFNITNYDIVTKEGISISDISEYSTIIWHNDDTRANSVLQDDPEMIDRYLRAGGNLLFSGYNPSTILDNENPADGIYVQGDRMFDLFKIRSVLSQFGSRFNGATKSWGNYPDLYIDTTKTKSQLNYHIRNVEVLESNSEEGTAKIYEFNSGYDISTTQGSLFGYPVGHQYLSDDYKLVILSFPLYYIEKEAAKIFVRTLLEDTFDEVTSIKDDDFVPTEFVLKQNYPNPFNPTTKIEYSLISETKNQRLSVELKIYDLLGREVTTLVTGEQTAGNYQIEFNASQLSSGIYIYQLKAGKYINSKKMMLLK